MTLGEFRTFFKNWLNRSDCTDGLADTFIGRAVARIEREVRMAPMERAIEVTVDDAQAGMPSLNLPTDFLAVQYMVADGYTLDPAPIRNLLTMPAVAGRPRAFARLGNQFLFRPYPTQSVCMSYYGQFDPLVNDTDTNVLTVSAPEVLLWACMSYAADYFRMDEMTTWEQRYQAERDALVAQSNDADFFASPQAISPDPEISAYT